jgi:hypothetical protein
MLMNLLNAPGMGIDCTNLLLQVVVTHLRMLMDSTAIGIDAATVSPALRPT